MAFRMVAAAGLLLLTCLCFPCLARPIEKTDSPASSNSLSSITIEFFYEQDCNECDLIRQEVLPLIEARYDGLFKLVESDMNDDSAVLRMAEAADRLGVADGKQIFLLLNGQYAFYDPAVMLNEVSATMDRIIQNGIVGL